MSNYFEDIEQIDTYYISQYDIFDSDFSLLSVEYRRVDRSTNEVELYDAQSYYDRLSPAIKQSLLTKFMSK